MLFLIYIYNLFCSEDTIPWQYVSPSHKMLSILSSFYAKTVSFNCTCKYSNLLTEDPRSNMSVKKYCLGKFILYKIYHRFDKKW